MATYYWVGGPGTWANGDTSHWSLSNGGAGGGGYPVAGDQATFTSLSGLSSAAAITLGSDVSVGSIAISNGTSGMMQFVQNGYTVSGVTYLQFGGSGATYVTGTPLIVTGPTSSSLTVNAGNSTSSPVSVIMPAGTATLAITGGCSIHDLTHSSAGAINMSSGVWCYVHGAFTLNAGSVADPSSTGMITFNGPVVINAGTLTGYTGTTYVFNGSFTMNGGTFTGGWAGVVDCSFNGNVTIKSGASIAANASGLRTPTIVATGDFVVESGASFDSSLGNANFQGGLVDFDAGSTVVAGSDIIFAPRVTPQVLRLGGKSFATLTMRPSPQAPDTEFTIEENFTIAGTCTVNINGAGRSVHLNAPTGATLTVNALTQNNVQNIDMANRCRITGLTISCSAANVAFHRAIFTNAVGTGGASFRTMGSVDMGGNSGWAFFNGQSAKLISF